MPIGTTGLAAPPAKEVQRQRSLEAWDGDRRRQPRAMYQETEEGEQSVH